ncbi:P22 phage major capsid protein family protein [Pseudoclavibacter helvolus]|uniref:Major capsid protein E n=1 Tax=Pseudoclavibacter helvolus TaxID=255205 RepID=A0A7W4YE41_9MICO|nr:P22 phage major capsid protein family protein [Pseudoclavibacter helvolus]MBB2956792.1 hypothetical protein [Pseudoclavibacter helvolus]
MAHLLFKPEEAAKGTIAALRHLSNLPRTVRQDFSTEFVAGRGQTVNVLAPITAGEAKVYTKAKRDAREAIQFNELNQKWVPVTLEDQIYNAVRLPDDFATFRLTDMTKQVLRPQAESVVDGLALPLVTRMQAIQRAGATEAVIPDILPDGSNFRQVLIQTRRVLNDRKVPTTGRTFAVGSAGEAAALSDELLQKANESGTTETLRNATIGRLFGFDIVADPALPETFGIAYHKDAFAFVTRPSAPPKGAAFSGTASEGGFALRWIQHYNPLQLEDQSIVDTFYGATTLEAKFAVSVGVEE